MIEISFVFIEALLAVIWVIVRAAVWIKNKKLDPKREALLLLMYVNLAVIIRFTMFPMKKLNGCVQPLLFDPERLLPFNTNLIPFVNTFAYSSKRETMVNVIGNSLLLTPTGIILPILYKKLDTFPKVLLTGALMSLCIEIAQLPFFTRVTDTDDLILNTLGVAIGYGIYALASLVRARGSKR